jgi:hypothetical protein
VIHGGKVMESATFRKWLTERGCRFDRYEHEKRGEGQVIVTVHREGRKGFLLEARARYSTRGWRVRLVKSSGLIGRNCQGRWGASEVTKMQINYV